MPSTPRRSNKRSLPGQSPVSLSRPYLSIAETADYLGVTDRCVRQMISDGRLVGYKLGTRLVRLRRDEIDAAMRPFGGATYA